MKTILVVDDKPEVIELVSVTLEMGGYKILTATNGNQALEIAYQEHPDLMLLDIQMPGGSVDGFGVCRTLKADPVYKDIFIILLTAKGQSRDKELGKEVGADSYLVKPFSPLRLLGIVNEMLAS
ncbi:MAG: response regulator [Anaerolineae bacterium]|nr:response regulator [Anaerolineae bacterium]